MKLTAKAPAFPFGFRPIFRGKLLVLGRVSSSHVWYFNLTFSRSNSSEAYANTIHVWHIYLHVVDFHGKWVGKYTVPNPWMRHGISNLHRPSDTDLQSVSPQHRSKKFECLTCLFSNASINLNQGFFASKYQKLPCGKLEMMENKTHAISYIKHQTWENEQFGLMSFEIACPQGVETIH